ncbi:MAG: putative phage tail assembly chaperone [Paraglaciecola sp.]
MSKNIQQLSIELDGKDANFTVTREHFNRYTNDINMNDKVAPSQQFVMRCTDDDSKTLVKEFINNTPGSEIDLAGAIASEYKPDTEFVVKKRSSTPSK